MHRAVVRAANKVLRSVPVRPKYQGGLFLRKTKLPYRLCEGRNVVQIGAPFDTLGAGRSRAAYLGMCIGPTGKLLVVEPLPKSASAFEAFASEQLRCDTTVVASAVWDEPGTVELMVDDEHPATNFAGTSVDYEADRLAEYRAVTVPSNTLDAIVAEAGFPRPDIVSITTNWAELTILKGMTEMIAAGVPYICVALGPEDELYERELGEMGYDQVGFDDRGATYKRREASAS